MKLAPYLEGLPALQETMASTAKRVDVLDASHDKTLQKVDQLVDKLQQIAIEIREVIIRYDNSREQNMKLEESLNEVARSLRERIRGTEEHQAETDIAVNTLQIRQTGALSFVAKASPVVISVAALLLAIIGKGS